jgi:hypothetical protein
MNGTWIFLALGVVGAVVSLIVVWNRDDGGADLGAVSSQWIAEHRQTQGHDSRR